MTYTQHRRRLAEQRKTKRRVVYHSTEWNYLVEHGWITMLVDGNVATMLKVH